MIVCVKCNREMRPKQNGASFIEMAGNEPYKLWMADLWECQECGAQILYTNTLQSPIAQHFQPDFADKVRSYKPQYRAKEWNR